MIRSKKTVVRQMLAAKRIVCTHSFRRRYTYLHTGRAFRFNDNHSKDVKFRAWFFSLMTLSAASWNQWWTDI